MNKNILFVVIAVSIILIFGIMGYSTSNTETELTPSSFDFFPIGLYAVDDPADFPEIAKAGFNLVQSYRFEGFETATDVESGAYLDAAQQAGLRVLMGIPQEAVWGKKLNIIRQRVLAFKDHPALYGWQLYDEPEGDPPLILRVPPLLLLQAYQAIKEIDPIHPVSIAASGWLDENYEYAAGADTVGIEFVAVPSGIFEFPWDDLAHIGGFYVPARETGKPFLAYIFIYNIAKDDLLWPKNVPKSKGRYPTKEEIRFLAYGSLIYGAQGLLFNCYRFDYGEGRGGDDISRKANPKQWQAVSSVAAELRALSPVLSTSTVEHTGITVTGGQAAIMLKKYQDQYYLFIANLSSNAREFDVKFDPNRFPGARTMLYPEKRNIPSPENSFTDQWEPYDVRIYVISTGRIINK